MDRDLAQYVKEDLEYLFREWNQDIDDASLRRNSTVLRSLLVEGKLAMVAKSLNRQIQIQAPLVSKLATPEFLSNIGFYQSGGATHNGMKIGCMFATPGRLPPVQERQEIQQLAMKGFDHSPVKLGTYLKQTSFALDGTLINREEVVKYVVNKLGGAHFDNTREIQAKGREVTLEQKFALLDDVRNGKIVADKNAVYYELLSIGQRVVNSRDVRHLRKHLAHVLSLPGVIELPGPQLVAYRFELTARGQALTR